MKAKRQILSLLLALVMVWQGFSFANAAGSNQDGINLENEAVEIASSTEEKREEAPNVELTENGSKEETNRVAEEANEANGEDDFDDLAMLEELSKNFSEEDLNALIAASAMEVSDTPKAIDGVLSNYKLTVDNVDVQDGTTITSYDTLQFKADIKIDSTKNVKKGDYILIKLPNVLKSESSKFSIPGKDDTGKSITLAEGIYDAGRKEIKITFTEEAEKYTTTSGEVYFAASIDKTVLKESKKNAPLQITVNNKTEIDLDHTVNYEVTNRDNPVSFWKASERKMFLVPDKKGITHYLIQYKITIDERNVIRVAGTGNFKNVKLVDQLISPELSYFDPTKSDLTESDIKTYSPTMQKGNWYSVNWVNNQWENAITDDENSPDRGVAWKLRKPDNPTEDAESKPWSPTYAKDGRSFTYDIGDLNPRDGYTFIYYVEINDKPKTTAYNNLAKLEGDPNIKHDLKVRDSFVNIEGGFLNGLNTYNIEVRKTDNGNPAQPLKDAEFTLKKKGSSYSKTAKTDEYGIASFKGLLYADYELEETKAPEGYEIVDSTPISITTGDLTKPDNVNKTFVVKVTNKKKEYPQKETVAFSVEKQWIVDAANPATIPATIEVYLKKNGVKDPAQKLELSATNNWKASFSNLPKEDEHGNAINYDIEELAVEGFTVGIAGDAANGFTVKNSQKPTVPPTPTTPATPSEIPPTPTTPATPSEIPPTPTTPATPSEIPPTPTTPATPSEIPPTPTTPSTPSEI
ncbi:Ig-like domain-containing protein, partial [Oribacterium parvum]|uniref:Ig-like domain-containing protein n=1 Tax=Oribacterium parvum TaxID=1501329 RepID=UPI0028E66224